MPTPLPWPDLELIDVGTTVADLETPVPLIDVGVVERNLARWQARCTASGISNRPHIKTHKLVPLAKRQLALGACGITCQKLGEAEVMVDAGIGDVLVTFNIVGQRKLDRLAALARRAAMTVVADSPEVVEGLGRAASVAGAPIRVLVECDTGAGRCGVQTPEAARALAGVVAATPGLLFAGLMTYPKPGSRGSMASFLTAARGLCEEAGLAVGIVSTGGTPDMWSDEGLASVTEYRAGTYVYNDRSLVARGAATLDDCAISVLTTVVSRPTEARALIDAGSKALTSDLLGLDGYGLVREYPQAHVARLDEEHGYLALSASPEQPAIGERVRIVPNHACVVSNLFDSVVLCAGDRVLGAAKVDARGLVA